MNHSNLSSQFSYYQTSQFMVNLGRQKLTVVSKPGLPNWNTLTPAALLLGELVQPQEGQTLLLGCGNGALAAALAHQAAPSALWATDDNILAIEMTSRTAQANQVGNLHLISQVELPASLHAACQQVIMLLPKGRRLARRWLIQAWQALSPGGFFYLAGAKAEGIQSIAKDAAALFGQGAVLGYKKGNRCLRFLKGMPPAPLPEWASEPGIASGTWNTLEAHFGAQSLRLNTLPGVFSSEAIDQGTHLLLENLPDLNGEIVLDIGCGYGVIGILAALHGAAHVTLADSSLLAAACAQQNLAPNQVNNAQVVCADLLDFDPPAPYTTILSNPPFHSGKAVDYQMTEALIRHARLALAPGGRLILVANRFIRYERLMQEVFGGVTTLAQTGQFHLLATVPAAKRA